MIVIPCQIERARQLLAGSKEEDTIDISKHYSIELNKIDNHLADLERGHIYELTKTPGTPSCATLAQHLREDIAALLDLIQNDKPSVTEKVAEASKNI